MTAVIRPATPGDLDAVVTLCGEHAAFERATFSAERAQVGLGAFLFEERPRAWCLVVEANGMLIGYATYSLEFSTWRASEYAHMDCLYLKDAYRSAGIGRELITKGPRGCRATQLRARRVADPFVEWRRHAHAVAIALFVR